MANEIIWVKPADWVDGSDIIVNVDGEYYDKIYLNNVSSGTVVLDSKDTVTGKSIMEVTSDSSTKDLVMNGGDVVINDEAVFTVNNITVNSGYNTIKIYSTEVDGKLVWNNGYDATKLFVNHDATLEVDNRVFLEIIKADIITVRGELVVGGGAEWKFITSLMTNHTIARLTFKDEVDADGNIINHGDVTGFDKLNIAKSSSFYLGAENIYGTTKSNYIKVGENADVVLDANIDLGGGKNYITVYANACLEVGGDIDNVYKITVANGKVYRNVNNVKVQGWTEFSMGGDFGKSDYNQSLSIGSFAIVKIGGAVINSGINASKTSTIYVRNNSQLHIGEYASGINRLTLSDGKAYVKATEEKVQGTTITTIGGLLSGTGKNDLISTGKFTNLTVNAIDFLGGRDKISIGAYSEFNVGVYTKDLTEDKYFSIKGVNIFNVANGGIYKDFEGNKQFGNTVINIEGKVIGTSGRDTITIGYFADFTSGSIDFVNDLNTMNVKRNAKVTVIGDITYLNKLIIASSTIFTNAEGFKEQGTTSFNVSGKIFGTTGNDLIQVGEFVEFFAGGIEFLKTGKNSISVGSNSEFIVGDKGSQLGGIQQVNKISVADGKVYIDAMGEKKQGWTEFHVNGGITTFSQNNAIKIGKFVRGGVDGNVIFQDWTSTFTLGQNSKFAITGNMEVVNKLTVTAGTNKDYFGANVGPTSLFIGGNYTGTDRNDNIYVGKMAELIICGDLDMRGGSSDRIEIASGSNDSQKAYFRINGDVKNVKTVKFGSHALVEASTEAIVGFGKFSYTSTTKIYDIGTAGKVANSFTNINTERLDDNIDRTESVVKSDSAGWLSRKDDYKASNGAQINTYEDIRDYFKLDIAGGGLPTDLDGWKIVGNTNALVVRVHEKIGNDWIARDIQVSGSGGVWDLTGFTFDANATDYRISVSVGNNVSGIYGYDVIKSGTIV